MADKNDKILSEIYQNAVENGKFTREYRARLPKEERELLYELEVATGERRRKEENFLEEIPTAFINAAAQRMTDAGRATGETLNEFGFNADGMVDFFNRVQEGNKQWDTPEDQSWYSKLSTTVGSAAGSTLPTLAAGAVGSLIAPGVGTVAGLTAGFMQTFGDNVQRNRKAGYSEEKALGMAFLESAVDTTIENLPFGIIGKGAGNAFRAARATVKGHGKLLKAVGKQIANTEKNKLLSAISKKLTAQLGKKNAENLLWNWGKSAAMDGLGEAGEEALQYINSWANQKLGGDPNAEFSFDDFTDAIAQGLIGGFFLQAARSTPSLAVESYRKRQRANAAASTAGTADNQLSPPPAGADTATVSEDVPEYTMPQTSGNVAPVAPAGAVVSDAEAQIIADIDNMSDEAVRAAVGRMNMPDVNVADTPVEFLRKNLIDFEIARHRSEVEKNAAAAATAAGTVSTPVTAENSIARETLTPEAAPIVAPEVAETANIPASSAAPVAPVTAPTAAAPSIQSAVAPVAETPANDIPEYTMPDAVQSAEVEYTPRSGEAISEPENILSYSEADENLNDDFDVDSLPTSTSETSELFEDASAKEVDPFMTEKEKSDAAAKEIGRQIKETFNKEVQIDALDTSSIKDKDVRDTLTAAQRIFHALGLGKVVMVNVDDNGVFAGATVPGSDKTKNRAVIDAKEVKGDNLYLFHTAMHELVHNLIGNNREAYNKLINKIIPKVIDKKTLSARLNNYIKNRHSGSKTTSYQKQQIAQEEFICDTIADLMTDDKFWEVLSREDMSLAQKFLKALRDLLAKITSGNREYISRAEKVFQDNLQDVIDIAQQFVVEASKKDISSLIRAKNTITAQTAATAAAETSATSEIRKPETAVPEKGTAKENLEVAPTTATAAPSDKSEVSEKSDTAPTAEKTEPTTSDKIRKKPEKSEVSDQSEVSDRQTFSDKFRAKEKEITGTNNPNIIIAESTPQGLKSVEKGDTLKETETSAKTTTEDKSNDKRTLASNTGLSSDTNAPDSHDGVSETTSDRTAGEKGTGGVSGSYVRKSDGTASAGKSSVAAESGLRNSDGDGGTAGRSGEQETGEVVSGGNRPGVQNVERASSARVRSGESASAVKKLNANNFRITPETNLVPAGDVSKTQANIEAIKLIKTLDKENRQATAEEKQILAKYTGWGGLSNVFYPSSRFYSELKSLLTQKEFQDAQASTINAHYTERGVISAMWDVASHLGFKGGKVGEFGAGVGHFLGLIPDKLFNKTAFKAVELDTISGKILQYLYPGADVTIDGLEHVKIANNSLDMVIGNFPFAKEGPYDRNYPKFNLHNYFFARAIDAVKPGGLVVALTSNSTLDSINQDARKYFAERADFVGAIRLPNNAFKKNAGTEVVTDIIVFRKHDGTESNLAENKVPFLRSVAVDGVTNDENNIRVNEYFVNAHPDMVLGKITSQGSMYRGDSMTVEATTEPDKLPGLIEKALKKLPKDIMGAEKVEIVADTADMVLTDEQKKALREGEVFVDKLGTPMIYQDGKGVLFTKATDKKLSQNEIKKIQSFVKLKETYNSLMETMRSDASDAEVKKQQQQLNKIYDEHVKRFGYLSERRKYTNLVNDPGYLRMSALENKETITDPDNPKIKKTVYKKSDVFTLRTIKKAVIPTHADNASDAAIISINYTGKLDFQFMEKLTGKPAEQIKSELLSGGNFFVDPASGLLVEKEEYLSGNIAQKIFEVEQQITENPELSTNLEALKAVLPQPKEIGKISFNLGATWMPPKVIEKWIKSVYNVTAKIRYSEKNDLDGASAWKVEISNPGLVTQFNIGNRDIEDLIEDSLNLRRTKVYGRDSDGKPYLDKEKTQTANSLQEELKRSFVDFVRTDSESATAVEKVYNDTFNVFVERKIDPAKCLDVYPGASDTINGKPFRLRDHQKAVVSRCIRGNTLIAHCVGAGKTVEMITANMELIRLGLASKGLILVQKSTLGQFAEEAQQLYPNARILAADAKSMEKKNRRRFLSKIANGSWDMVIMPHPSFDNLLLSPELQRQQIEDAISEVVEAINEQKAERNSRLTIKELERKKKALTAKLEKLQSRVNEEDTFYFDELGFDAIFVDEAHNYKKLDFHTKLGNIKGLDKSGSSRAFNMKGKLDFIRSKTGGRNIYFATGTPVTNTLAEVWNMIRFVSPETLEEFNVRTFDQFAATFTATVNAIEQNAAGNWKAVERFSEFTNIEELHKFVSSVMDIILPEDLKGVKRPTLKNGKPTYVTTDRTEELTRFVEQLKELYEAFDAASGAEKREYSAIPLMIYGLAKKASIDMRLINESFPDDPNSKLNAVVENAFSRYKELSDIKGTQAIFCDMYRNVDKKTGQETFNVYKELKRKLVEKGVPESEIAIINDYTTDSAKEKLFELVNAGEVRFVMGSTQKLGTGVNIQEKLAVLHHIDAPPRPSDMEQRDGRIIRQGNTISEPEILCFAVDKTLDSFSYAMLARKAKFINMALKGKANESGNLEVTDDDVIDYAAFSAETSGDKRAVRYVELNKRADELENAKRRYQKNVYDADGNIERYTKSLNTAEKDIKSLTEFIEKYGKFDLKTAPISLNGRTLTGERGEILSQLDKQVFDKLSSGFGSAEISIGDLGIRIKAEIEYQVFKPAETKITYTLTGLEVFSASGVAVSGNANTAQGLMQSLGAMLKKKSSELDMLKEKAKSFEGLIEQQKKIKNSKFEFADELDEVIKERDELQNELANEAAEKGKDKKHLTLPQAAAMLGLSSEDFLIEDEDTDSDLKLSAPGDRVQNIEEVNRKFNDDLDRQQKKVADELLQFRGVPQGSRPDNESVTAVRRLLEDNIAQFPEKIKEGFAKIFDSMVSGKPSKWAAPLNAKNFVTSSSLAGFRREPGESAYMTINGNTLRVAHHATTAGTFLEHNEAGNNIISIVAEKHKGKYFKGDERVNLVEYVFDAESISQTQLALLWYDISAFLKTGEYTDHVGANHVHFSGTPEFKDAAKKKVEADKQALYQKTDTNLKFSMPGDRGDTSLDPIDYRRSIDPLFDFFMEYSDNGILNPGSAHIGEDFSGAFISPEFVAYSVKRKQGKNEADATYRKYIERRQSALENASGASLDTMAKEYVEKFGGNEAEVAEKFLDMLRHLTKKDLISERAEAKREVKEAADKQRKEDEAEWQKQKAETLRKKVDELFKAAKPVVDKRWIQINRQIYTALFKTVFPDAEIIPDIPSDREMRILNMVLENGNMSEAALIAEPYYTDKDKVLKDKLDKAQAETLTEFILRSRGGKGFMGLFHDINGKPDINLLEYALMTPMWIAKKFAGTVVESIYKAARMMVDDKNRIMRYLSGDAFEKLMQLRQKDKAMYDKLNAYILKCDRDQTGAGKVKGNKEQTEFTATTADGEVIGKFDNEETAWDALFKREQENLVDNGYSKLAAESLYEIRSAMRRSFLFRLHSTIQYLRQAGLIDAKSTSFIIRDPEQFFPGEDIPANQEIDLFELMREMGQRSGYYMPRIRHGKYMLRATKAGHPVILKGFDSKLVRANEIRKLRKEGYKTENFLANTPDQDMLGQLNPAALSDILNQAMERAKDVFSKDIKIDEVSYVTKDGKNVPQLAVTSKMKLSYAVTNTLKKLGGRYYDGAWRFDNFTPETKTKLKEIIESEVTNEVKTAMVMQSVIGSSIVDMIRENSSGSSKIARRTAVGDEVVQGYEEDVLRAYGLYISGVSGASARNVMAKKMYAAFGGMDFDREEYINSLIPENLEKGTPEYQEALTNATAEYFKEVHRRALNSAKSPRIAKYMDKYIKDMLRNSTSLDRVLGAAKGISAVWMLNKPASAINNLFGAIGLVPAVIDTETKCGVFFALGNMLSGLNKYIKYAAYNKWGQGKPLTGVDSRIFDIIHKNSWDGAEMVADATKAGLTFANSKYQAFSNFALIMFSMVERGNRASSIYAAAMALAKKRGVNLNAMNDVQLQDFLLDAVKISDFGNGVYDKTNKLTWARGGDWQSVIDSALLFKTYEVNYYNNMWNMFNHKNLKGLLYTTISILAMGGGKASIPVTLLLGALSLLGITDPDDEEESDEYVYNLIADVAGQGTANVAKYGVPSLLGINLSGTYRDTITDALHDGVPDGTISISDLPAYSIFKRYENMKEYGFTQPGKMVEEILPAWLASGSRAIRESYTGVTDRAGRQRKDVNNEYIKPDGWDTFVRTLGFNPVSISEKTDRIWTEKKVKEKYAEQRREIYSRYRDYMKSGDTSDSKLAQLAIDIEEYNAKVARSNRNIPLIDEAGLNRAAKDTESKFLKSSLDEKAQQRREKKEKGKIVIRNGKLVREE